MRLLDAVAQSTKPFLVQQHCGERWRLSSACDFKGQIENCPLRYVLADDLVRVCMELAFSMGDQLSSCLDLIHVPSQQLWIEWSEAPRIEELSRLMPGYATRSQALGHARTGVYIAADSQGRRGTIRTFWTGDSEPDDPLVAALETHFDLDEDTLPRGGGFEGLFEGAFASVLDGPRSPLNDVLNRVRYRFDDSWSAYYREHCRGEEARSRVACSTLGTVAYDIPMLLALFLLQSARVELPVSRFDSGRLNAKRLRKGKVPLLDCIELAAPVFARITPTAACDGHARLQARRHHVRGHLVRRQNTVYWRSPHWRGHVCLGHIASRTVSLHAGAH
jgi:hypothetical protein